MLGDDDMTVFFNPDFASTWVRLSGGDCAYVEFPAIRGEQSVEALQAYASGTVTELTYITSDVDLRDGQQLQIKGTPQLWRVRKEPEPIDDGATSVVQVGKVTT